LAVIFILTFHFNVEAGDWPQWGGDNSRNMASSEVGLADFFYPGDLVDSGLGVDLKTAKNVKWAFKLGSKTYGTPAVRDGKIVVGTNDDFLSDSRLRSTKGGRLICLDEKTGKLIWHLIVPVLKPAKHRKDLSNFDIHHLGVSSSPTIDGNRVYVVTNRGDVVCLDINGLTNGNDGPYTDEGKYIAGEWHDPVEPIETDADIIWHYDMISRLTTWPEDTSNSVVMVLGDFVYVNTSTGIDDPYKDDPDRCAPSLIVLDKMTGQLVATDNEKIPTRVFHGQWSSPAVGNVDGKELILFGAGDGFCYAFEPFKANPAAKEVATLKNVWKFDCNPSEYKSRDGKPIEFMAKGDGPSNIIGTPVFHGNRVYLTVGQDPSHNEGKGVLNCIDATGVGDISTSGVVWKYKGIGRSMSTVSVVDGLVFAAETFGIVHCIDAKTGKPLWTHDIGDEIWGSTLVADAKVYIGNTKRQLWIFAADKNKKVLNTIQLGAKICTTPVAANGTLYIASSNRLYAVQAAR
jgi:outer membrane protein assembly factor BamB